MSKYYYRKATDKHSKKWLRLLSLGIFFLGSALALYIFHPLILWQIYLSSVFASQNITTPIPKTAIVSPSRIASLIENAQNSISLVDYTNAKNWFPTFNPPIGRKKPKVASYTLSIPKIRVVNALASTTDTDLGRHLVNYKGTSVPGDLGNAVIFGHSTLPQLYNPLDYKTIFANVYKLEIGDNIHATVNGVTYTYKVHNIIVVDPSDTSFFSQSYDNSYLTLVTCTPPGTIWKRLIIKARLKTV